MKVLLISLGCDKNRVDSEYMLGMLVKAGHTITDDEEKAEAIIVNSCCFIGDAKEESINTILEMSEYKTKGKLKRLIVTGCLAQRYAKDIKESIPEVDAIVGTTAYDSIVEVLEEKESVKIESIHRLVKPKANRLITGENYVAYLKIAEGCNKHCTYCVIPSVRGNFRSVPLEDLVNEAKYLVESGARELILVAQETTLYGIDLFGEKSLHVLLNRLSQIEDLEWIRIMYCYPEEIYDELIQEIKTNKKVLHYLDMPVQHGADNILKAMGRKTSHKQIISVVKKLRKAIPDIALRTSLIVGFPGETDEDVEELINLLDEVRFARAGVFTYSKEEGTAAAKMAGQIPARVKKSRQKKAMKRLKELSYENCRKQVGRELEVLVEGYMPDEEIYVGRSYMDAPGIDGQVFFKSQEGYMSGDLARVIIEEANDYDLIGSAVSSE